MNFLDAHKMVHDFGGIVGKYYTAAGIPISKIPFRQSTWKDDLVLAFQLFFAHSILWCTRTNKQLEQYYIVFHNINDAKDDKLINDVNDALKLIGKEKSLYGKMNKKKISEAKEYLSKTFSNQAVGYLNAYRIDDYESFCNHMIDYKNNCFVPAYQKSCSANWNVPLSELVFQYCCEAYESAKAEYKNGYDVYFYSFDQMREWVTDKEMKHYFSGYEEYLMHNQ